MKFEDLLIRYHISPLSYDDGSPLSDKDYCDLFSLLLKWLMVKNKTTDVSNLISENDKKLIKKFEFSFRNSLYPLDDTELLDIINGQDSRNVVKAI